MSELQGKIDALTVKVGELTTVVESAVTLLDNLARMIRDAADDPAELQLLADTLDAQKSVLADAVARNTTE